MPTKKTIDIDIDSSKLEKALKNLRLTDKHTLAILKTNKQILDIIKAQKELRDREVSSEKKILDVLKERESIENRIRKIREDYAFKRELSDLEKPKSSLLEQYQKYKGQGISGVFQQLGERAQEEGALKVSKYDEDIAAYQEEQKSLQDLYEKKKAEQGPDWEKTEEAKNLASDISKKESDIKTAQKEKSKTIGETKTQVNKYAAMAAAAQKVSAQLEKMGKAVLNFVLKPFKDMYKAIKENITAMVDWRTGMATYATGSSLITNASAREQQMKYGLTSSQNWAFTQAKSMLGIQSDEDLMYMNSDQRDRLLSYMDKYSQFYDEMESSGVLDSIQEMQLEFAELKQEIAMEFLAWVAENKDTIMYCIKGIFEFIKAIANFVMDIVRLFGKSAENYDLFNASASDRINNDNSRNTVININANTTNNAMGVSDSKEAIDKFNDQNWSEIAKKVVGAMGG